MITTLRFAKNTLYNSGVCGKLFQIAHYAEELITANQETDKREMLDALVDLDDFAKRAKRRKMKVNDVFYLITTIQDALKTNPVTAHA